MFLKGSFLVYVTSYLPQITQQMRNLFGFMVLVILVHGCLLPFFGQDGVVRGTLMEDSCSLTGVPETEKGFQEEWGHGMD